MYCTPVCECRCVFIVHLCVSVGVCVLYTCMCECRCVCIVHLCVSVGVCVCIVHLYECRCVCICTPVFRCVYIVHL